MKGALSAKAKTYESGGHIIGRVSNGVGTLNL